MWTKISEQMAKKNIKNIELARLMGVSEIATSAWKTRRAYVPEKHRQRLAEVLGVNVDHILDEHGLARPAEEEEV